MKQLASPPCHDLLCTPIRHPSVTKVPDTLRDSLEFGRQRAPDLSVHLFRVCHGSTWFGLFLIKRLVRCSVWFSDCELCHRSAQVRGAGKHTGTPVVSRCRRPSLTFRCSSSESSQYHRNHATRQTQLTPHVLSDYAIYISRLP